MATTVFRVIKTENFTTISNFHLQDKTLSLKAKGMLTLMLSLNADEWDMSLKGLATLSRDGLDSTRSTVKELEERGYLKRTIRRNELGQMEKTEYTVYEISIYAGKFVTAEQQPKQTKHTADTQSHVGFSDVASGTEVHNCEENEPLHVGKSDVARNENADYADEEPPVHIGKSDVDEIPTENGTDRIGFSNIGKPNIGKSDPIKYLNNKDTDIINNSSSSKRNYNSENLDLKKMEMNTAQRLAEERRQYEQLVKENIDYDGEMESCLAEGDQERADFLNLVVDVAVDAIISTRLSFTIKKQEIPAEVVKSRLLNIKTAHVDYAYDCLQQSRSKIINMHNYILTVLYNSLSGSEIFYRNWVQHDEHQRAQE